MKIMDENFQSVDVFYHLTNLQAAVMLGVCFIVS